MRSPQWEQGRRFGVRRCVAWLHERAEEMNDPNAKAILNTAAFNMGTRLKGHVEYPEADPEPTP